MINDIKLRPMQGPFCFSQDSYDMDFYLFLKKENKKIAIEDTLFFMSRTIAPMYIMGEREENEWTGGAKVTGTFFSSSYLFKKLEDSVVHLVLNILENKLCYSAKIKYLKFTQQRGYLIDFEGVPVLYQEKPNQSKVTFWKEIISD